jgi:hypothetical protein
MRRIASILASLFIAHFASSAGPAFACGQIAVSHLAAAPGAQIEVRGFAFWSDPRPVTLAWEGGRRIATVELDGNGTFSISISVPEAEGVYRIRAVQGSGDSAPFYASVRVTGFARLSEARSAMGLE